MSSTSASGAALKIAGSKYDVDVGRVAVADRVFVRGENTLKALVRFFGHAASLSFMVSRHVLAPQVERSALLVCELVALIHAVCAAWLRPLACTTCASADAFRKPRPLRRASRANAVRAAPSSVILVPFAASASARGCLLP